MEENILIVNSAEEFIQVVINRGEESLYGLQRKSNKKGIILLPKMIKQCLELTGINILPFR